MNVKSLFFNILGGAQLTHICVIHCHDLFDCVSLYKQGDEVEVEYILSNKKRGNSTKTRLTKFERLLIK